MSEPQTMPLTISDQELVLSAKDGDEDALNLLIHRYAFFVRMRARAFSKGMLDADDLYQEGMIALLSAVRGFREEKCGSFKTFVAVCVNNKLRNAVTAHMREKNAPMRGYLSLSDTEDEELLTDVSEDPAQMVIVGEELALRRKKMDELLSSFERQVLVLYLRAFSYGEMASSLGTTVKSVDNALQRVRRKLQDVFADE